MDEQKFTYEELLEENIKLRKQLNSVLLNPYQELTSDKNISSIKVFEFLNSLGVGVLGAEPNSGKFIYANSEIAKLTGYSIDEMLELEVSKFHPLESLEKVLGIFDKLVSGDISKALELPVVRKDGKIIYFDVTATIFLLNNTPILIGLFTNVSDLVENNKVLFKTKEMYSQLVESSSDGIIICEQGRIIFANPLACGIFQLKANQLINNRVEDFLDKKGSLKIDELKIQRELGNLEAFKFDCKDSHSSVSLEIISGKFNYLGRDAELVFIRDISEVAAIAGKIRETENKSEAIFKALPDMIFRINKEGFLLDYYSIEKGDLLVTPSVFIGKKLSDVLPPDIAEISMSNINKAILNNDIYSFEYSLELNGTLEYFEARISPVSESSEAISIVRNITQRTILQKEVLEKENLFKTIANNSKDVIWIYDLTNNKFTFNSPSVFNLRGYTPEEASTQKMEDVFTPETLKMVNEQLPKRLKEFLSGNHLSSSSVDEFMEYHKNGSIIHTEVNTSFFENTDSSFCVLGITRDITNRKNLERKDLLQKDVLELIVTGNPLIETFKKIVEAIEFDLPGSQVVILTYNAKRETLDYACGGNFSKEYLQAFDGIKVGQGVRACGHAVFAKSLVITEDILKDANWASLKELAIAENLRSCFSLPILSSDGSVLGTFAVYHKIPYSPTSEKLSYIESFVSLASIAIQRYNSESSLRESEDKFSKAFNASPDSFSITTFEEGIFIDINEVFQEEFKYLKEEIIGKNSREINIWAVTEDRLKFRKMLEKTGKVRDFETILCDKNGNRLYFLISSQVIHLSDGSKCILSNSRNITKAKLEQQEKERLIQKEKESSGRIVDILETISDGFVSIDKDWKYTYMNIKAGEILRKHPKSIVGKVFWDEFQSKEDLTFKRACSEVMEKSIIKLTTDYIPEFDKWLESKIYPAPEGINIFFRDITEQKKAELKLIESEIKFRNLFESTPDGIIYYDEQGREELFNSSALKILNIQQQPRVKVTSDDVPFVIVNQDGEEIDYFESSTFKVLKSGIPVYDKIYGLRRKTTNETLWLKSNVIPFKDEFNKTKVFTSFANITEQRQAEAALHKSQRELKRAHELAKLGNFKLDIDNLVFTGSEESLKILGFEGASSISIKDIVRITHPSDKHLLNKYWHQSLIGVTFNFELRIYSSGKVKWLNLWGDSEYSSFTGKQEVLGIVMDITERKTAELNAKNEKERLQTLIETIPDLVWLKDPTGKYILCNPQFSKLYNMEASEMVGISDYELMNKELADHYSEIDKQALEANEPVKSIGQMSRPGYEEDLIVETFKTKLFDTEGNLVGILGVGRDLTEITSASNALVESERKLKEAQHFAKMGNWELNFKTNSLLWSDEVYKIFEIDKSIFSATYEAFINAIHPDDRELVNSLYTNSLKSKKPYDVIHRLLMPDGRIKYVQEKCSSSFDENGEPIRSVGTVQDISEIHLAQQALKEREQILSSILDTVGNGIFLINIDENREFRFQSINRMMAKIIGVEENILKGKRFVEILPDSKNVNIARLKFDEAIKERKTVNWEINGQRSGEFFTGDVNIVPVFDNQGNCVYIVGAIHDITLRKRAEEELSLLNQMLEQRVLERTEQLESANKELESFAYSVSHDLRAPLRHIDGFTKILRSSLTQINEESIKYFNKIDDAGNRMSTMIDSLLKFSRLGRQSLQVTKVDFNKIIEQIIKDAEPDLQGRDIEFQVDSFPSFFGDKHLLEMAFNNLILNSVKFTQNKKNASIHIGNFDAGDDYIGIFVKDNGAGFDMAYVDKLFGVFQRLHSQNEFSGTGIGLANVQQIIKKHNGFIWAEGQENLGATFYIKLKKNLNE
ncbi:MAG: PAS domain S-box protein [Bacteroidia bacterium]